MHGVYPLKNMVVKIHTGLSFKDETGIVARPWTDFFVSWISIKRASPSVSGKLKANVKNEFTFYHSKHTLILEVISRLRSRAIV